MAGHSKFKNIMHRKGAQDARRAKKFARLTKELQVAVRGGTDPSSNPRLRSALSACRAVNMPKDNIERVIKKAEDGENSNLEEIRYEGYAPGGVALIVDALTDNRNRTAAEVRSSFTKYGGYLGETGSVSFMFNNVGQIVYKQNIMSEDEIFDIAIEVGANDVKADENNFEIINNLDQFVKMNLPVLLGASRKSFIGVTLDLPEKDRLEGSIAANIIGLQKGAKIFRVHDVAETNRAMVIANKIFNSNNLIN